MPDSNILNPSAFNPYAPDQSAADQYLDPSDTCGCGDTGYLTVKTVPIDLAHGVGYVKKVPVYLCRSQSCNDFTLPQAVARRLEDIAEEMEKSGAEEVVFSWFSGDATAQAHRQAFTLQFNCREYEDARVVLVVPGQAVFLQSTTEPSEYYLLHYEENYNTEGTWFSFIKFYYDEPGFSYEEFLDWAEDGYLKELGCLSMDEVEDALVSELGEWE